MKSRVSDISRAFSATAVSPARLTKAYSIFTSLASCHDTAICRIHQTQSVSDCSKPRAPAVPAMSLFSSALRRQAFRHLSRRTFTSSTRVTADHVRIIEVGPRDGLQNEKRSISPETKIELVTRLAKTGLDTIEAGSFVSPKWVPQVWIIPSADHGGVTPL